MSCYWISLEGKIDAFQRKRKQVTVNPLLLSAKAQEFIPTSPETQL